MLEKANESQGNLADSDDEDDGINDLDSDAALFVACFCILSDMNFHDDPTETLRGSIVTWVACVPAAKNRDTVELLVQILARFPKERVLPLFNEMALSSGTRVNSPKLGGN